MVEQNKGGGYCIDNVLRFITNWYLDVDKTVTV